jgi:hypothetical protein
MASTPTAPADQIDPLVLVQHLLGIEDGNGDSKDIKSYLLDI